MGDSIDSRAPPNHLLFGHPLFNGISDADLARVAPEVKERLYPRGQYLCYTGDRAHSIFIIKSGLIALTEVDDRGNPYAVHIFGPNDVFGAMVALLGKAHTGSAIAIVDTTAVVIPDNVFVALVHEFPKVAVNLIRELYGHIRRAEETILQLTMASAASRVAALLLKLGPRVTDRLQPFTVEPRLSHETIALLLGTTRRTVTRTFTNLTRAKLISTKGHRIVVLQPEKIRQLAEGERRRD